MGGITFLSPKLPIAPHSDELSPAGHANERLCQGTSLFGQTFFSARAKNPNLVFVFTWTQSNMFMHFGISSHFERAGKWV